MDVVILRSRARSILVAFIAAGALALGGCGGGGEEETAAVAPPGPPAPAAPPVPSNSAPTISGTPLTTVMPGTAYAFVPTANDADGNALTFSIANRPAWAAFNASTGRLSGTPSAGDVATYSNITVSVSDGTATASLATFAIEVVGTATGSAMLSWTPPTQNTDGSPLTNLAGYRVYWGTSPGSYTNSVPLNNPGLSSYVVDQLTPATWYFVMTAVNASGAESPFSNVAARQVL